MKKLVKILVIEQIVSMLIPLAWTIPAAAKLSKEETGKWYEHLLCAYLVGPMILIND